MKKIIVYILSVITIFISGCSFNENGEYFFYKIKYEENGVSKETDCSNSDGLPIEVASACNIKYNFDSNYVFMKIDNGTIYINGIDSTNYKYIIENDIIKVDINGEYIDSSMRYSFGKIYYIDEDIEYIFKK